VEAREAKVGNDQLPSVPQVILVPKEQDIGGFDVSVATEDFVSPGIPVVVLGDGFSLLV